MKKNFLLCFLMIGFVSLSQESKIPKIQFEKKSNNANEYIEMLKIEDKNALFLKITNITYGTSPRTESNFIVYLNNGEVTKYNVVYGEPELKIKKNRIQKKERKTYWAFLNDCVNDNRFILEKQKLNATSIPNENESNNNNKIAILDGGGLYLELAQNDQNSLYNSDNAEAYIKYKVYGYTERQKFLDLVSDIQELYNTNSYSR